jgi:glycosyltransferase involved in cell wall biosynthesis
VHISSDLFDRSVASILQPPVSRFIGFNGQSLRTFRKARALECPMLELVAATGHVDHIARQHAIANARYPIESDWLNETHRRKTVNEYAMADVIHVGSQYSHASFVNSGVPAGKLRRVRYPVDPRFTPAPRASNGVLRIVYTGSITVTKGVPVLLEAMERLRDRKIELTLIGGCATRRLRVWLDGVMARDPRITRVGGDPVPYLRRADVYVHPSFQDGFGYAPMEALACGVPVIVTDDTGMKEHVREGINGYVVPTGDVDALVQRLEHIARNPLHFTP